MALVFECYYVLPCYLLVLKRKTIVFILPSFIICSMRSVVE